MKLSDRYLGMAVHRKICTDVRREKQDLLRRLIAGRGAQEALDLLKFTHKRAAEMIEKALKSAIANADEACSGC